MKTYIYLLAAVTVATIAVAQTTTPATETEARPPAQIFADNVKFDTKTRIAVYQGSVRVDDTEMKLACDTMTVWAPEQAGRIQRIVAEGNVVVDWMDDNKKINHAKGQRLVYTYKVENSVTNDLAVLTGDPKIERPDSFWEGDVITWDRITGAIDVSKAHMTSKSTSFLGTNAPAATQPAPTTP